MRRNMRRIRDLLAATVALCGITVGVLSETGTAAIAAAAPDSQAAARAVSTQYYGRSHYGPRYSFSMSRYQVTDARHDVQGKDVPDSFVRDVAQHGSDGALGWA